MRRVSAVPVSFCICEEYLVSHGKEERVLLLLGKSVWGGGMGEKRS